MYLISASLWRSKNMLKKRTVLVVSQAIALLLLSSSIGLRTHGEENQELNHITNQAAKVVLMLSYDRNLDKRAPQQIKIAVVYANKANPKFIEGFIEKLTSDTTKQLVSKPIVAEAIQYKDPFSFRRELKKKNFTALYLMPDMKLALNSVTQTTRALKISTFSGQSKFAEMGAAVSIIPQDQRIDLVVNIAAARAEGMNLPTSVLIISKLVE